MNATRSHRLEVLALSAVMAGSPGTAAHAAVRKPAARKAVRQAVAGSRAKAVEALRPSCGMP